MTDRKLGEFELIERFFAPLATGQGAAGLKDDAAAYTPQPGHDLVISKDMLASGVHFFPEDPPEAVAAKALRVNLSDIVSKGARPTGYVLGLGLGADMPENWVEQFCAGLAADQERYDISLLGGDTISTGGKIVLSVTLFGEMPSGGIVRRTTAQPGDLIFFSGTLGDSSLGLQLRLKPELAETSGLSHEDLAYLKQRYLLPEPRTAGHSAVARFAAASMDVSDGLAADLGHMCRAAGLIADVDVERLPLSGAARRWLEADQSIWPSIVSGGDDYELLCAVRPRDRDAFLAAMRETGTHVTEIGRFGLHDDVDPGVRFNKGGTVVAVEGPGGYRHV